ncbi:DUF6930 domain-containing protein [Calothrix sp. NIES-3974]|uniref:DUF6930 domain-containing protein n=1 Tax=Calothrix sp. NIES-3974 TaxID=2005462 RepID=UPI000B5FC46E|nr:hypothetical protein [Calothrix sp. NIES-3974]BAZ07698.1 hypothetical protein NIES3974_43630 [Calothrix sp. NIES-3974]
MTSFNRSTSRRLQKLAQVPSIWEGDRRPLSSHPSTPEEGQGECILWVDASQGIVRGMDVVAPDTGPEAIVRTLMRAMENPHSPAKPARPQRIVVCDREIQFYLRGVLQDLDIAIDYAPELPLIDELFRGFAEIIDNQVPELPPLYAQHLYQKAHDIWETAPWEVLEEQQILSIEINRWDIGTLYVSVMGMLGMEYGVLLYRSVESLKTFRANVLRNDEIDHNLEEAFLKQDCLFLTFEGDRDEEEEDFDEFPDFDDNSDGELEASFGNIHPLEGLRSVIYDEEALVVYVALESICRFLHDYRRQLYEEDFPAIQRRYRIHLPETTDNSNNLPKSIQVNVATMPDLAQELLEMADSFLDDQEDGEEMFNSSLFRSLRDDLIPKDSFLSLGVVSWDMLKYLRTEVKSQHLATINQRGDGLPVVLIQTSRPKAKQIIEKIEQAGGLKAICFNPGADPFGGEHYDLGLLQTHNGDLFLFGEFDDDDPTHVEARRNWNKRCKHTQGYCGLIIAKGLTGASGGKPQLRDMMALFEARSLSPQELGIGTLQLMPQVDFE